MIGVIKVKIYLKNYKIIKNRYIVFIEKPKLKYINLKTLFIEELL